MTFLIRASRITSCSILLFLQRSLSACYFQHSQLRYLGGFHPRLQSSMHRHLHDEFSRPSSKGSPSGINEVSDHTFGLLWHDTNGHRYPAFELMTTFPRTEIEVVCDTMNHLRRWTETSDVGACERRLWHLKWPSPIYIPWLLKDQSNRGCPTYRV